MAFVAGGTLGSYVRRLQQTNQVAMLRETTSLAAQAADALGYAHQQGVIHRDVKPDNVLLKRLAQPDRMSAPAMRAIVTDFGLAKLRHGGMQTQTGAFMGTMAYMSPEQCLGRDLDGRSDVYSLGVMLYQLATGRLPFNIQSPIDAAMKHLNEAPPAPSAVQPGLPATIEAIINKAIAKQPGDRFQTAGQMAAALRQAAASMTNADVTRFAAAAHSPVVSLATQLLSVESAPMPSRMDLNWSVPPGGNYLIISRRGAAPRMVNLNKPQMSIGRSGDNDILLDASGISRRHARLEQTSSGWRVVDLGSANGAFLEGSRLLPDVPEAWPPGKLLRIGPFFLRWEAGRGMSMSAHTYQATARSLVAAGSRQILSSTGQLSVTVSPANVEVVPGHRAEIQVELFNQGAVVDHFRLSVEELPSDWVTISQESVQLMDTEGVSLSLTVHPPPDSSARAGQHPYRLAVSSTSNPGETAVVSGQITVKPYEQFTMHMQPTRLSDNRVSRVTIRNEGNADLIYSVTGNDPAGAIHFEGQRGRLRLAPNQTETLDLKIAARKRPFLGHKQALPFTALVKSTAGIQQVKNGLLEVRPILPGWAVSLFGLLLFVCIGSAGIWAYTNAQNAPAEATGVAATSTANAALRAEDDDRDGLSNDDEQALNTDLGNPDTDGDGLSDGQEVNQYQTNPRKQDSDEDGLTDGEEANSFGTDPANPDTDGDGMSDGVDDDPLQPPTAVPTATEEGATAPPDDPSPTPTRTPSGTPPPGASLTPTPSPSGTPPPGAPLTPTPTPSNTPLPRAATVTNTPLPPPTPTNTPLPPPTPTNTPIPMPTATDTPLSPPTPIDTAIPIVPNMSIPGNIPAYFSQTVAVSLTFTGNSHDISAVALSVDFDEVCLLFESSAATKTASQMRLSSTSQVIFIVLSLMTEPTPTVNWTL